MLTDCTQPNRYSRILDQPVPIPSQEYPLDPVESERWIQNLCTDDQKRAGQILLDITRYIDFPTFQESINVVVDQLLPILENTNWVPWVRMTSMNQNFEEKSGIWVLRLALHQNPNLESGMCLAWGERLYEYIDQGITTFVILDDAMYTGTQVSDTVQSFFETIKGLKDLTGTVKLIIAVPFISDQALYRIMIRVLETTKSRRDIYIPLLEGGDDIELPTQITLPINKGQFTVDLQVIYSEKIYLADMLIENKDDAKLVTDIFGNRYPIYFAHKMPDYLSSYPGVYAGYIPPCGEGDSKSQVIPFVQGCEDQYKHAYAGVNTPSFEIFSSFDSRTTLNVCPKAPYKP